jgi:hypothetical protein
MPKNAESQKKMQKSSNWEQTVHWKADKVINRPDQIRRHSMKEQDEARCKEDNGTLKKATKLRDISIGRRIINNSKVFLAKKYQYQI